MEVKPGYKQTEVGLIPEDWNVTTIGSVAETSSGTTPSRALAERYYRNGHISWVKTLDLNNSEIKVTEERVTQAALGETSLKCYPSGSVVVAMYGGFNQIGGLDFSAFPPPSIRHSRQYDHTRVDCAPSICKAYLISELTIGSLLRAVAVKTRTSRAGYPGLSPRTSYVGRTGNHCRGVKGCGCPRRILGATHRQKAQPQARRDAVLAHRQEAPAGLQRAVDNTTTRLK